MTNTFKLESNTNVLCAGTDFKISVEGKYKDFKIASANQRYVYPTIKQMKTGRLAIIQNIINNWLDAIQEFCVPDLARIDDLQHQFLLRLVDACNSNAGQAIVLYQFFYEEENALVEEWIKNLRAWKTVINPNERLSFFAQKIQIAPIDMTIPENELLQKIQNDTIVRFVGEEMVEV